MTRAPENNYILIQNTYFSVHLEIYSDVSFAEEISIIMHKIRLFCLFAFFPAAEYKCKSIGKSRIYPGFQKIPKWQMAVI